MFIYYILLTVHLLSASSKVIFSRRASLAATKYYLATIVLLFKVLAIVGVVVSLIGLRALPTLPSLQSVLAIAIIGIAIPIAWYVQLKIIAAIGANNWIIVNALIMVGVASTGVLILGEPVAAHFALGLALIIVSVYLVSTINPDTTHAKKIARGVVLAYIIGYFIAIASALTLEKHVITSMGVYNYLFFGWPAQLLGIVLIKQLFFRKNYVPLPKNLQHNARMLAVCNVIASTAYVLAVSIGKLSQTVSIVAGKVVVTFILAAIFLHETNQIQRRLIAMALTVAGIIIISL